MLKDEVEQRAKEKVLLKIINLPQFTHDFLLITIQNHTLQNIIIILFFIIF